MAVRSIGFIGLGAMGKPMARCLLTNGFEVKSCANVSRDAIEALKADGLIETRTPREVAEGADAVIVMVRDVPQTDRVIGGDDGALQAMAPGSILVLMSTLLPGYCIELAEQAKVRGVALLDAPVSGLPVRAEQGTLTLMVGGDASVAEQFRPAFEAMGTIFPCGGVGMGMVAKLANNMAANGTVALVSEVTRFADAYGMKASTLLDIMSKSTGDSFAARNWEMVQSVWPDIKDLAVKDFRQCIEAANERDVAMPLGEAASQYPWTENL